MVDNAACTERLQVLLSQEANHYRTTDYLTRMQVDRENVGSSPSLNGEPVGADGSNEALPDSKRRKSAAVANGDSPSSHPEPASSRNGDSSTSSLAGQSIDGSAASASHINKHWREKICEWAYQVVDHFDLNREVVSITMNHLDRFLATCDHDVEKNTFQLLAMTSLYLAIKLNEYKHLLIPGSKSSMDTILQLSRGFFTLQQMEKMEYDILQRLQWHLHPPTPQLFVKHFLCFLSPEHQEVHDLAQFLVELSVMDYFFVSFKPSEVAIAAILNALEDIMPQRLSHMDFSYIAQFFSFHSHNVYACRERLALIYAQANDHPTAGAFSTPTKGDDEPEASHIRTVSPVSVMAPPQPTPQQYNYPPANNDAMEAEYSDDEDDL